ncbi:MAG: hypothetical protein DRP35_10860 [Candidatus Zixiibacteriota bacterium]|nr:MAG: hypothetical protein DRP35_10860 [candidate division Zixibacteria bacterium]
MRYSNYSIIVSISGNITTHS